jgi:hypothetical protein
MFLWFNSNAAAIQALAGLANVMVAALLAWLTARYVRLTSEATRSSEKQADHWNKIFEANRKREALSLAATASQIRYTLSQITLNGPIHEQMGKSSYLYHGDIKQLITSAVDVGSKALDIATKVSEPLYQITYAIEKASSIYADGAVWTPTEREKVNLGVALESSSKSLTDLENHCKQVADSVVL